MILPIAKGILVYLDISAIASTLVLMAGANIADQRRARGEL